MLMCATWRWIRQVSRVFADLSQRPQVDKGKSYSLPTTLSVLCPLLPTDGRDCQAPSSLLLPHNKEQPGAMLLAVPPTLLILSLKTADATRADELHAMREKFIRFGNENEILGMRRKSPTHLGLYCLDKGSHILLLKIPLLEKGSLPRWHNWKGRIIKESSLLICVSDLLYYK